MSGGHHSFDIAVREACTIKQQSVADELTKRLTKELMNAIKKIDTEFLAKRIAELALERDDWKLSVMLPAQWGKKDGFGGPPPDVPAMLYVCLKHVESADDPVARWSIPLSDVAAHAVELHTNKDFDVDRDSLDTMRHVVAQENASTLVRIRDRLREIADKIDQAIEPK